EGHVLGAGVRRAGGSTNVTAACAPAALASGRARRATDRRAVVGRLSLCEASGESIAVAAAEKEREGERSQGALSRYETSEHRACLRLRHGRPPRGCAPASPTV